MYVYSIELYAYRSVHKKRDYRDASLSLCRRYTVKIYVRIELYAYRSVHKKRDYRDASLSLCRRYTVKIYVYTTRNPSWNQSGVDPGNQEGPGC